MSYYLITTWKCRVWLMGDLSFYDGEKRSGSEGAGGFERRGGREEFS